MPQVAKPTKIEPGILSCLTSLNIDDVSQYKEKETPTPSGIAECKINIMKMLDDSVSSKPIMQKTAESTKGNGKNQIQKVVGDKQKQCSAVLYLCFYYGHERAVRMEECAIRSSDKRSYGKVE